jgi:hypothetical protein
MASGKPIGGIVRSARFQEWGSQLPVSAVARPYACRRLRPEVPASRNYRRPPRGTLRRIESDLACRPSLW